MLNGRRTVDARSLHDPPTTLQTRGSSYSAPSLHKKDSSLTVRAASLQRLGPCCAQRRCYADLSIAPAVAPSRTSFKYIAPLVAFVRYSTQSGAECPATLTSQSALEPRLEPFDDIIDAICDARNKLKPNPERHVNRNTRIGQRRSHHDSWQSDCFRAVSVTRLRFTTHVGGLRPGKSGVQYLRYWANGGRLADDPRFPPQLKLRRAACAPHRTQRFRSLRRPRACAPVRFWLRFA
jgi:hypothetical protein